MSYNGDPNPPYRDRVERGRKEGYNGISPSLSDSLDTVYTFGHLEGRLARKDKDNFMKLLNEYNSN